MKRYLLIALLLAGCGPSTEEVRKIARDEADRAVKELETKQQAAANVILDKMEVEEKWTGCKSNLKNLGTCMEMYSTDWAGRYTPAGDPLNSLVPSQLKKLPACPNGGHYVAATSSQPDLYTIVCSGGNHSEAKADNFPQYTSITGLVMEPQP